MQAIKQLVSLPTQLRKRDGSIVSFDSKKILHALQKAGAATGEFAQDEARLLCAQVVKVLSHVCEGLADIERIQDIVEQTLITANHITTARAYIVYREQHKRLRQDKKTLVDVAASVNEYLHRAH